VLLIDEYGFRDVFQVHLMNDSNVGRDNPAILERLLSPFQEYISFAVSFQFAIGIESESARGAELVDLHGMIDDKIDLLKGIDPPGVATHLLDHITHGRQIDNRWDSRKILHQYSRRPKCNFLFQALRSRPRHEWPHVIGRHPLHSFKSNQVFQHALQLTPQLAT